MAIFFVFFSRKQPVICGIGCFYQTRFPFYFINTFYPSPSFSIPSNLRADFPRLLNSTFFPLISKSKKGSYFFAFKTKGSSKFERKSVNDIISMLPLLPFTFSLMVLKSEHLRLLSLIQYFRVMEVYKREKKGSRAAFMCSKDNNKNNKQLKKLCRGRNFLCSM